MSRRSPRFLPPRVELLPVGRETSVRFSRLIAPFSPVSGSYSMVLAVRPRAFFVGGDWSRAIFFCLAMADLLHWVAGAIAMPARGSDWRKTAMDADYFMM